jgi:hypothetical protein
MDDVTIANGVYQLATSYNSGPTCSCRLNEIKLGQSMAAGVSIWRSDEVGGVSLPGRITREMALRMGECSRNITNKHSDMKQQLLSNGFCTLVPRIDVVTWFWLLD